MRVKHRMLSWTITRDAAVAALPCDSARLLFTWMVAFGDNLGRMEGEPKQVNAEVGRRMQWSDEQVALWLQAMHDAGLIVWYTVDGLRYVQFTNWDKHQKLVGNMKARSDHPAVPQHTTRFVHTPYEHVHTPYEHVRPEGEGEGEPRTREHSLSKSKDSELTSAARRSAVESRELTVAIDTQLGRGARHERRA